MVGKEGEAQKTIKETTEIRIDQGAIYRLNAYGWEARRYAAGLTQIR